MKFPNAYKGLSKVLASQILQIISLAVFVIAAVMVVMSLATMNFGLLGGTAFATLAGGVIAIIALIINLVGLGQASKDEGSFRTALFLILIALGLSIAYTILMSSNPWFGDWMYFFSNIFELAAIEAVIVGVMNIAGQLGDSSMVNFGSKMRVLITIGWVVVLITYVMRNFTEIEAVLSMISAVVELVVYVMYVVFLARSKKMLA